MWILSNNNIYYLIIRLNTPQSQVTVNFANSYFSHIYADSLLTISKLYSPTMIMLLHDLITGIQPHFQYNSDVHLYLSSKLKNHNREPLNYYQYYLYLFVEINRLAADELLGIISNLLNIWSKKYQFLLWTSDKYSIDFKDIYLITIIYQKSKGQS